MYPAGARALPNKKAKSRSWLFYMVAAANAVGSLFLQQSHGAGGSAFDQRPVEIAQEGHGWLSCYVASDILLEFSDGVLR